MTPGKEDRSGGAPSGELDGGAQPDGRELAAETPVR